MELWTIQVKPGSADSVDLYSITPKNFVILIKFFKRISSRSSGTEMQRLRKGNP